MKQFQFKGLGKPGEPERQQKVHDLQRVHSEGRDKKGKKAGKNKRKKLTRMEKQIRRMETDIHSLRAGLGSLMDRLDELHENKYRDRDGFVILRRREGLWR